MTDLTIEDFERCRGDVFSVRSSPLPLDFTLERIDRLGRVGPSGRTPFSLIFRGPHAPVLPQAIYQFVHPHFEAFEIFIVPIGPDRDAMQYEAIFT